MWSEKETGCGIFAVMHQPHTMLAQAFSHALLISECTSRRQVEQLQVASHTPFSYITFPPPTNLLVHSQSK